MSKCSKNITSKQWRIRAVLWSFISIHSKSVSLPWNRVWNFDADSLWILHLTYRKWKSCSCLSFSEVNFILFTYIDFIEIGRSHLECIWSLLTKIDTKVNCDIFIKLLILRDIENTCLKIHVKAWCSGCESSRVWIHGRIPTWSYIYCYIRSLFRHYCDQYEFRWVI